MHESDDLYAILQVHPSAEQEVIKAAYQRLALKYHPDVNPDPNAAVVMRRLNHAYEVLSDPTKRGVYDRGRGGAGRVSYSEPIPSSPGPSPPPAPPPPRPSRVRVTRTRPPKWPVRFEARGGRSRLWVRLAVDALWGLFIVGVVLGALRLAGGGRGTTEATLITPPAGLPPDLFPTFVPATAMPALGVEAIPTRQASPSPTQTALPQPTATLPPALVGPPTPTPTSIPTSTPNPTSTPTPTPVPPLFTHSGRGPEPTPPFQVDSSPWRLQFQAAWDGHLEIRVLTTRGFGKVIVDQGVKAGVVYEVRVDGMTGDLYLSVGPSAPDDAGWTVWVVESGAAAPGGAV